MFTPIALSLSMSAAQPLEVARVEVDSHDSQTAVLAYDQADELAASIVLSREADGIRIDADFADGHWVTLVSRMSGTVVESTDVQITASRMEAIEQAIALDPAMEGWGDCLVSVGGTVAGCVAVSYFGCVVGSISSACECLPLMIEEFEGMECPLGL